MLRLDRTPLAASALGALALAGCSTEALDRAAPLAGGATTVFERTALAYSQPAPNLSEAELETHRAGDVAFGAKFVAAPAPVHAGLGPQFNNVSCVGCHMGDGRGLPVIGRGLLGSSLLLRVSPAGAPSTEHGPEPVPGLGGQLQDHALFGETPEVSIDLAWDEHPEAYGDGTAVSLRAPRFTVTLANGEPLPANVAISPRLASPVFGLGLLEAVPEADLRALADPDDRNHDGLSGRANDVWDVRRAATVLGRFGWKANTPTLEQQAAAAYFNDMGVSSPLFPDADGATDIDAQTLHDATFYTQTLAVPARDHLDDPIVQRGEQLFRDHGCAACHVEQLQTGAHEIPALSHQTIHPYSDLLLHDLGDGLADHRSDFLADGREWRTSPLWGVGLAQTVLQGACFLHDGRARTLEEAILWHDGEAHASREAFRTASGADREALVAFLRSL